MAALIIKHIALYLVMKTRSFVYYILVMCCGNAFQNTLQVYDTKSTDACLGIIFPPASILNKRYQNEFKINSFNEQLPAFHLSV